MSRYDHTGHLTSRYSRALAVLRSPCALPATTDSHHRTAQRYVYCAFAKAARCDQQGPARDVKAVRTRAMIDHDNAIQGSKSAVPIVRNRAAAPGHGRGL